MVPARLFCAFAGLTLVAAAAPVLSTDGYVSFRKFSEPGNSQIFCNLLGSGATACDGSGALRDLPEMTLTYATWAQAEPGVLKAKAVASMSGTGIETVDSVSIIRADATFRDQITFYGLPQGTPGSVVFSFLVSGSVTGTNLVHLNPGVNFQDTNSAVVGIIGRWYVGGVAQGNPIWPGYSPGLWNVVIPVTFEEPQDLSFTLQALLNMRVFADGEHAASDFSSTAWLAGMSAYDASGTIVHGFYAVGSGDSAYLDVGPAIPEPATWALAAAGFLVLAARKRKDSGRRWLNIVSLVALSSAATFAAPFYFTKVGFEGRSHYDLSLCDCVVTYQYQPATSGSYSTSGNGGIGSFSGSAAASSAFGALTASASFSIDGFPSGSNVDLAFDNGSSVQSVWISAPASGYAWFRDSIQVVGPAPSYTVIFPVSLSGTVVTSDAGVSEFIQFLAALRVSGGWGGRDSVVFSGKRFTPGTYYLKIEDVPANTPMLSNFILDVALLLQDELHITDVDPASVPREEWGSLPIIRTVNFRSDPYSASGSGDLSHTARFGDVLILNADGTPASGVRIVSENGFEYRAIPEPGTWALAACGLLFLCWRCRARTPC